MQIEDSPLIGLVVGVMFQWGASDDQTCLEEGKSEMKSSTTSATACCLSDRDSNRTVWPGGRRRSRRQRRPGWSGAPGTAAAARRSGRRRASCRGRHTVCAARRAAAPTAAAGAPGRRRGTAAAAVASRRPSSAAPARAVDATGPPRAPADWKIGKIRQFSEFGAHFRVGRNGLGQWSKIFERFGSFSSLEPMGVPIAGRESCAHLCVERSRLDFSLLRFPTKETELQHWLVDDGTRLEGGGGGRTRRRWLELVQAPVLGPLGVVEQRQRQQKVEGDAQAVHHLRPRDETKWKTNRMGFELSVADDLLAEGEAGGDAGGRIGAAGVAARAVGAVGRARLLRRLARQVDGQVAHETLQQRHHVRLARQPNHLRRAEISF